MSNPSPSGSLVEVFVSVLNNRISYASSNPSESVSALPRMYFAKKSVSFVTVCVMLPMLKGLSNRLLPRNHPVNSLPVGIVSE